MKLVAIMNSITAEQLVEIGYNAFAYSKHEWLRLAERYKDAKIFIRKAGQNSYPEFYAQYKTSEGMNVFASISVSTMLHSGGFSHCMIFRLTEPEREFLKGFHSHEFAPEDEWAAFVKDFNVGGKLGRAENTAAARKYFADNDILVTNDF
jgi:hypothetical protein